jgi:hypothetical protein
LSRADLAFGYASHALDIGFLHHGGDGFLGHLARLQKARKIAALAQLGYPQLDGSGPRFPVAVTIAVALVHAVRAALARCGSSAAFDIQFHQALGGKSDHLAQKIGVGGLFQKGLEVHHVIGHWCFLGCVANRKPTLLGKPMTDRLWGMFRSGLRPALHMPQSRCYTTWWDTTRDIDIRDMVAISVLLAGFTPYLSHQVDSNVVYRG